MLSDLDNQKYPAQMRSFSQTVSTVIHFDTQLTTAIYMAFNSNSNVFAKLTFIFLKLHTISADGILWIPVPLLFILGSLFFDSESKLISPHAKQYVLELYIGALLAIMVELSIKGYVQRVRPRLEVNFRARYRPSVLRFENYSFPSGHTMRAFFAAVFVSYSRETISIPVIVLSTVWAILVGVSRIACGRHYLLDVLFGGFFGSLLFYVFDSLRILPALGEFMVVNFYT